MSWKENWKKCTSFEEQKGTRYICSVASRYILVPFEQYGPPRKWAQKDFVTFFLYIFHVKTKLNIVYEYLKTKIFPRDTNILPQIHWIWNIFGYSATNIGGFWVWLNYPILNFKKMVCPKNVWMRHWFAKSSAVFHLQNCVSDFF